MDELDLDLADDGGMGDCERFQWELEQVDLELMSAPFQSEWREYEALTAIH